MQKSKEAYSAALKALDCAVKECREKHLKKIQELAEAQAAVDSLPVAGDALLQAKKAVARAQLDEVKSGFRRKIEAIYADFDGAVAAARRGLVQALSDASIMRAGDVDEKAALLLSSGAMHPRDLLQMVRDFSENAAVLSLLRVEAQKQWENCEDADEQAILTRVLQESETNGASYIKDFDNIIQAAQTLAGRDKFGNIDASALHSCGLTCWETIAKNVIPIVED